MIAKDAYYVIDPVLIEFYIMKLARLVQGLGSIIKIHFIIAELSLRFKQIMEIKSL